MAAAIELHPQKPSEFLGKALRDWRRRQGMTQIELATRLRILQKRVSTLESGIGWTCDTLAQIAPSLGISATTMLQAAIDNSREYNAAPLFANPKRGGG